MLDFLEPLFALATPNVAYIVLVVGLWAAALAVVVPGTGLLELIAVAALALSGLALTVLPVNWWGAALIGGGVAAFGLAFIRRLSALFLLLSALLLSVGSAFLFRPVEGGAGVSLALATGLTLLTLGYFWIAIGKAFEAQRARPAQDPASLIGQIGEVRSDLGPEGTIYLAGELWTARADELLLAGTRVEVVGQRGLTLQVRRAD